MSSLDAAGVSCNMEGFDLNFKDIVSLNVKILTILGVYTDKIDSKYKMAKYLLRTIVLMGILFGSSLLSQLTNLYMSLGDIAATATASYLPLTNMFTLLKASNILLNRKKLKKLINSINGREFQPKSKNQYNILIGYMNLSRRITITGVIMVSSACAFWALFPMTTSQPFLPMEGYIPYRIEDPFIFFLTYIYEIVSVVIGGYTCILSDTFLSGFLMVICAQLHVLNDSLRNLEDIARDRLLRKCSLNSITDAMLEAHMNDILVDCVVQHRSILEFRNKVANLFNSTMFGQFVMSVLILCTSLFELSLVDPKSAQFVSMIMYMSVMLLEIFLLCYFGNEILTMSFQLTDSAYHCNWLKCSVKFRKNLLLFMTRSQLDLKMYAGNFFPLTLLTFGQILKSTMSYYTVLTQLSEEA